MGVGGRGDVYASWFGEALQPRRDVNAIPEQVAAFDHHVTDMHSNPELETTILRSVLVCLGDGFLHGNGTLDGINGTGDLRKNTTASGVSDPPAVITDQPVHDLAMSGQAPEGASL